MILDYKPTINKVVQSNILFETLLVCERSALRGLSTAAILWLSQSPIGDFTSRLFLDEILWRAEVGEEYPAQFWKDLGFKVGEK